MKLITSYKSSEILFHRSLNEKSNVPFRHTVESHNLYELLYTIQGNADFTVDEKTYSVTEGDLVIIKPRILHKLSGILKQDYERYALRFRPDLLVFSTQKCEDVFNHFLLNDCLDSVIFTKATLRQTKIPKLFEKINTAAQSNTEQAHFLITAGILEISAQIKTLFSLGNTEKIKPKINETVKSILQYIDQNIFSCLSLEKIAEDLYLNKYYISHLFSKHIGLSLKKYISRIKIQKAEELIEQGLPPTEVALRLGFNYYSTFFNVYKSITGKIPSDK